MDQLQPRVAPYMTAMHGVLLIPSLCKSCLEQLQQVSLTTRAMESLEMLESVANSLGHLKDRMVSILPEQFQASMASMHGVHHNSKAILSVMRFYSRVTTFSHLADCIEGLCGVVEDFEDILRSHADFLRANQLLDPSIVDHVASHLHETVVRLHNAEIIAMKLVESHVENLASFKRGVFVSKLVGGSKALTAALVRRGVENIRRVGRRRKSYLRVCG